MGEPEASASWWETLWTSYWTLAVVVVGVVLAALHHHDFKPEKFRDVVHVTLPALVLIMEFFMLGRMRLESRERQRESLSRQETIADLNSFRIAIGRQHYISELERGIRLAERKIIFTSTTMAASTDPGQMSLLNLVIERESELKKVRDGYKLDHRGLIAKRQEALPGAVELICKTGVEVRFREFVGVTRLRFQVCDDSFCVVGVSDGSPSFDNSKPTERSTTIESAMLGEALAARFEVEWNSPHCLTTWGYLGQLIDDMSGSSSVTQAKVLELLRADKTGITAEKIDPYCQQFKKLPKA